ncbi:hypothetical protein MNBD_GAMMA21-1012 [hydrothermal vent metagenome]|uniref:PilZ domain-containing protein n=1 Tax=hydrothermal vent metagenome TaxID=652676 RepID=A0A3B1A8Q6_9ZZZZ
MATNAQQDFIERRIFARRLVNARVQLTHTTIGDVVARTRDISDTGVYVEAFPVPKLPTGSHVKMYMLDSAQPDIAFNMKVVRVGVDGLGLMFIDYEVDGERYTLDALRSTVSKKPKNT